MIQSMYYDTKVTLVSPSAAAAQTAINSTILDMAGWEGVLFIVNTGDVTSTSVLTLTGKCNTTSATGGSTTVTGAVATFTAGASDADDKLLMIDIVRPT